MELNGAGDLVKVSTGGPQIDGIVLNVLSDTKAVVAVIDRARGPVLRTVDRRALAERTDEGPDDQALHLLIRRTPPAARGAVHGRAGAVQRRAGHTRAATHRPTGK
jgi:hypothetical protein